MLRLGNVHSAERWREILEPVVKRYQEEATVLKVKRNEQRMWKSCRARASDA